MARSKTLESMAAERGVTVEKMIASAIAEHNGNIFKAAVSMGKYPNTLYNWLRNNGKVVKITAEVISLEDADPKTELEAIRV